MYSEGSNPVKNMTGSERWTETIAEPRLHSVLTVPLGKFGEADLGMSIEFRRDDWDDVSTNDGAEELEFERYSPARAL